MAKVVFRKVKLQIESGSAKPSPPVGPVIGQTGISIMAFCKAFNAATQDMEKGIPIPTTVTCYKDKSFDFTMSQPPVSFFLKKEAGVKSGSKLPGKESCGSISREKVKKIAELKMQDMGAISIEGAVSMVEGSAFSMGMSVVD
ncbi:50S ribosomal protein L11 [Candidatus Liberibacter africanus]|uniref:Large ribosomal subunit protein uL11 n=1 Tax=Candidatus Liberibacter africanus PTSAPSY TaxID=1277257 RepID=A0A0G3I5D6_LIBAF|nr:50S ribosomal protein L11 [Candidatus Liberibacter africanus]AKK20450.1 50S ribosomal protein L11 [Candidatus Liberibacter africanus PTSAPSY]QTP64170.1 50S ribosomal protein L11 [Candidatus Liberibacter africanus]